MEVNNQQPFIGKASTSIPVASEIKNKLIAFKTDRDIILAVTNDESRKDINWSELFNFMLDYMDKLEAEIEQLKADKDKLIKGDHYGIV